MKNDILKLAVIPGLVLLVVTIVRARLEITSPDSALTHALSANYATLIVLVVWPILMLAAGASLKRYLWVMAAYLLFVRLPIAVVYTMSVAQDWRVEATGEAARYTVQVTPEGGTPSALLVFLGTFSFPFLGTLIASVITWSLVWAIGFRTRRPYAAAAA